MTQTHFIPISQPSLDQTEVEYVTACVKSGWVSSLGSYIPQFERVFAGFCGCKYGVSVFNGTVALHLALVALGIGPGDEVIVPTLTFIATANAVLYTGATPIFVDSELETWNMDPIEIAKKITPKTKAIIAVHLYGHPANIGSIMMLAKKHKLLVVEDAAESHGAEYNGRTVGSFGDVGCFSFYGNKIITTGEGGMIVTQNKKLAERMQFLKDHAMSAQRKYFHPLLGFNYRMTNLQAALGMAQMKKIDRFITRKREIAALYARHLTSVRGITLQPEASWAKSVHWMSSILVTAESGLTRDQLAQKLKTRGIDSRPFFIPNHQMPYFPDKVRQQHFPIAEQLSQQGMNLPSSVELQDSQVVFIAETIRAVLKKSHS